MKMFTCWSVVVFIAALFAESAPAAGAHEMRTWNAKDGTESVEGSFRALNGGILTVLLPNGRSRQIPTANLSDADVEYAQNAAKAGGTPKPTAELGKMGEILKGKLVPASGAAESETVPKYYIFYYSASWCPPCRAFTPDLVSFYNRTRRTNPEIEVVLVSSDRSEDDALAYQKDYRMKFPQLKFDELRGEGIPHNPGRGIPALRMVDANGDTVLTSAEVNRSEFLDRALKIAKGG